MTYFGLAALTYRYLFLYVYTPDVDMNGGIWQKLFSGSAIGLLLGNTVVMSLVAASKGPESPEFVVMFFLPFFTAGFLQYANVKLQKPTLFMCLEDARKADAKIDAAEAERAASRAIASTQHCTGAAEDSEQPAFFSFASFNENEDARSAGAKIDTAEAGHATAAAYCAIASAQQGTGAEIAAQAAATAATRAAEDSEQIAFVSFDRDAYLDPILSDPMWDDFDESTRANMLGR